MTEKLISKISGYITLSIFIALALIELIYFNTPIWLFVILLFVNALVAVVGCMILISAIETFIDNA